MNKRAYAEAIATRVNGEVKEVSKVNGIKVLQICIGEGAIRPSFSIDRFFEEGMSVDKAVEIIEICKDDLPDDVKNIDLESIHDYDHVKNLLRLRLFSDKTTAEIYKKAPFFEHCIIIPYIQFNENAVSRVTTSLLDSWGICEEEMWKDAYINMQNEDFEVRSLLQTLLDMDCIPDEIINDLIGETESLMYVLSNKSKHHGAIGLYLMLDALNTQFPEGFFVLPSSIHEIIIVPKTGNTEHDKDALNTMVCEINRTSVSPEDFLSDEVLEF